MMLDGAVRAGAGLTVALAATPLVQQLTLNEISVPVLGANLTVILAGAIGSLASTLYEDPDTKRSRLFGSVLVATVMGPVSVVALSHGFDLKWAATIEGPLAVIASFAIRLWLPAIVERGRLLIRKANVFSWMKTNDGDEK